MTLDAMPSIRELAAGHIVLEKIVELLLAAREAMWREFAKLHREVLLIVKEDQVCRRLMTVPGLGALSFRMVWCVYGAENTVRIGCMRVSEADASRVLDLLRDVLLGADASPDRPATTSLSTSAMTGSGWRRASTA